MSFLAPFYTAFHMTRKQRAHHLSYFSFLFFQRKRQCVQKCIWKSPGERYIFSCFIYFSNVHNASSYAVYVNMST